MSLGSGSIFSGSWKQELVTCSTMESEVIGMYDVLPHILWTKKSLDDQGLQLCETIIYQDDTSSILLEKNGHHSSSHCTKHMDVWYLYITNHVKNKEISIQHCPTEELLANYFIKPLQGSLFLKLQTAIMGHGPASPQKEDHTSVLRIMIPTWKLQIPTQNETQNLWLLNTVISIVFWSFVFIAAVQKDFAVTCFFIFHMIVPCQAMTIRQHLFMCFVFVVGLFAMALIW